MENINVYVRMKPTKENESNFKIDKNTLINNKTKEIFTFDSIISSSTTNEAVFSSLIKNNLSCLLQGINVSIFAYGQTSTGKTFTMKGKGSSLNGIIPLSIKELFSKLSDPSISKSKIKVSYAEIYNETVNDLIDSSKKNLEIRESVAKGVFVNNLTEVVVPNYEKVIQIMNTGENNRMIAETKLNEKSSRSHTIFKIFIEFTRKDDGDKEKRFSSQLNLIDLAGSENASKAKCEGIRFKEGTNINKSLLALSNVINRLSQNSKNFVNYRDSKLTRLLQTALGGNSKTAIICTIADDNSHYQETLNTLHFGLKAKNVKTTVRINEIIDEKGKIALENNQLKSRIKMLEDQIIEEKGRKDIIRSSNLSSFLCTTDKKEDKNEELSALQKEVTLLKRLLINNKEEVGEDQMTNSLNNDLYSVNSGNLYHGLSQSGYKTQFNRMSSMSSAMKLNDSAMKYNNPYHAFHPNDNFPDTLTSSAYRRPCMTEMRFNPPSTIQKTSSKFITNSAMNLNTSNDFDYPMTNTMANSDYVFKENEDLRRNLYEMRKTYYEVVQSKENQIKLLNQNHSITLENCEKLIKEAEDNYLNLKLNYDQAQAQLKSKDDELATMTTKTANMESSIKYYKEEIAKMKDLNYYSELEDKIKSLKEENDLLKESIIQKDNTIKELEAKVKEKASECDKAKESIESIKKANDKEAAKLKNEIKMLKNTIKNPNALAQIAKNEKKKGAQNTKIISEYESKISKLEAENNEFKTNLEKIETTQIVEYQKLLDESFDKINELNKELCDSKERVKYLEKTLKMVDGGCIKETPLREIKNSVMKEVKTSGFNLDFNINEDIEDKNASNDTMLGKKRKYLPKIYQTMIDKNLSKTPTQNTKENYNCEISNFQI